MRLNENRHLAVSLFTFNLGIHHWKIGDKLIFSALHPAQSILIQQVLTKEQNQDYRGSQLQPIRQGLPHLRYDGVRLNVEVIVNPIKTTRTTTLEGG